MFIRGADVGPRGPAPELGQHTAEVLREAGLSDDEWKRSCQPASREQRSRRDRAHEGNHGDEYEMFYAAAKHLADSCLDDR